MSGYSDVLANAQESQAQVETLLVSINAALTQLHKIKRPSVFVNAAKNELRSAKMQVLVRHTQLHSDM